MPAAIGLWGMNFYRLKSGRWVNLGQATFIDDKGALLHVFFADAMRPELVTNHDDAQAIRVYLEKNAFHPTKTNS
jgi:hypothetical protein